MLRGPCPHSLSWPELILQNKTGRVGKVWGRKYPSVSPLPCPHCTDHYYSLTHTWPSGGWGLLFVITPSDDGQFSRCMVTCLLTILTSPRSDVWSIFENGYAVSILIKRTYNKVFKVYGSMSLFIVKNIYESQSISQKSCVGTKNMMDRLTDKHGGTKQRASKKIQEHLLW